MGQTRLAKELAGLGLVPVISTATEATGLDSVEAIAGRGWLRYCQPRLDPCGQCRDPGRHDKTLFRARPGDRNCRLGCFSAGAQRGLCGRHRLPQRSYGRRSYRAVRAALAEAGIAQKDVQLFATTAKKCGETGLIKGIASIPANLIFLDDDTINAQTTTTPSKAKKIGLVGVAEPCALAVWKTPGTRHEKEGFWEGDHCHRPMRDRQTVSGSSGSGRDGWIT